MDEDLWGMISFGVLFVGLVGFIVYMAIKEQKKVEYCFLQETRTKECALFLYEYEHHSRTRTTIVPMPEVVRR